MRAGILGIADAWWARDFACAPGELRPAATRVQAHAGALNGDPGIWILVVGEFPLVSLPPDLVPGLEERARRWQAALVADPSALAAQLEPLVTGAIIGPAFIGYSERTTFARTDAPPARALTPADGDAVARLRARCAPEEWEHGGSDLGGVPTFGVFDQRGELSALAGYETWAERIAHISIVTAGDCRGRGLGGTAWAGLPWRRRLSTRSTPGCCRNTGHWRRTVRPCVWPKSSASSRTDFPCMCGWPTDGAFAPARA